MATAARYNPVNVGNLKPIDLSRYVKPDTDRYRRIVVDDVPRFDHAANPEIDTNVRLPADLAHVRTPTRRLFVDYRSHPEAYRHLETLPTEGQTMHGIISGKYALWDLVPALIEKTGQKIDQLYLATLGFSKQNGADLCGLLDSGHVGNLAFLISYYFKSTSGPIYDAVVPELISRKQRVLSMRNHSKLIIARMEDGSCYSVESSANLRSSVNLETFVMTRCPDLYAFHSGWIEGLFGRALETGKHGEHENHTARKSK